MYKTYPIRVLCLPCGSGVSQEIFHSLCYRRDVELYGLDSNENTPGKALFGKRFYHGAPLLSDRKQLLEYVKYFVALHEIKHIFPGTDDFVNFLKENEEFLGARVVTSSLETCIVARSKGLTYQTLGRVVRVPRVFKNLEEVGQGDFPLFLKPDKGSGSIGCKKMETVEELVSIYDRERDLITELLPGKEYTVDCLSKDGELLYHCPRERTITRAGISIVTSAVKESGVLEEVQDMAHQINNSIEFKGAWFFQVKHSGDGSLCLLEIAPRIAGAMCFSRMAGVNLPLLSLNISAGIPVRVGDFNHPDRTMKLYKTFMDPLIKFDNLYVDLDDTLVVKGKVNSEAMACLYRYSSRGVPIHLITRRPTNLGEYLRRFHIPESIFTSIRQIFDRSPKSLYIVQNSIFVDDSFKERSECSSVEKNIRCFDTDAFSFL